MIVVACYCGRNTVCDNGYSAVLHENRHLKGKKVNSSLFTPSLKLFPAPKPQPESPTFILSVACKTNKLVESLAFMIDGLLMADSVNECERTHSSQVLAP